jgi:hypothetical protein
VAGLMLLCVAMTGCKEEPFSYSLRQDRRNIDKVAICTYDHGAGTRSVLVELSDGDSDKLVSAICALECHKAFPLDPILSYGDVVICITYLNGEIEIIGIYNIGWITPAGDLNTTLYYFDIQDIRSLIAQYVDSDILAEVSEEF